LKRLSLVWTSKANYLACRKTKLSMQLLYYEIAYFQDGFQGVKIGVTKQIKEFWAPFPWVFIALPIGQT
jgi:hypothetical protein